MDNRAVYLQVETEHEAQQNSSRICIDSLA